MNYTDWMFILYSFQNNYVKYQVIYMDHDIALIEFPEGGMKLCHCT